MLRVGAAEARAAKIKLSSDKVSSWGRPLVGHLKIEKRRLYLEQGNVMAVEHRRGSGESDEEQRRSSSRT